MMKLKILGSGSSGNCYVLDDGKEALVIECGIDFEEVKKSVDFNIGRIVSALLSHEHGDHSRYVGQFIKYRIPIMTSAGTEKALKLPTGNHNTLLANSQYHIGNFVIKPFSTLHDAEEPLGFLIWHRDMGVTMFATDTRDLKYVFDGLNNIMLECNYDDAILQRNINSGLLRECIWKRTLESHCSLSTCKTILKAQDLTRVNNIVLLHLSDGNSNAKDAQMQIESLTGKHVTIAENGIEMNFGIIPF